MSTHNYSDALVLPLTFGALLIYSSLANLHFYLCVHGFVKFRRSHPLIRDKRRNYVRVMFVLLALSTTAFAFELADFYISSNFEKNRVSVRLSLWLGVLLHVFIGITHLTADGLLVWRCYVIWTGRWYIGVAPLLPYFTSLALGILAIVSSARCAFVPKNNFCVERGFELHRGLYFLFATSVNVVATTLICIRLLRMKRRVEKMDSSTERLGGTIPYTRVTMVLVESALPFTVMGISTGIIALVKTPSSYYAWIFVSRLWTMASALAAQLIIYRVITGISWTSDPEQDVDALSQSMHFAPNNPASTGDLSETTADLPRSSGSRSNIT
ncbi:hypothetical protein BKA70DRAFT_1157475 [Coprinopsis sp. MPI-PUGE-AT-0042]|nr:hypothetical protein BKA70DRAFT_1157475 [Coprinopsis sp. MPI-PUGE-AT-0042]